MPGQSAKTGFALCPGMTLSLQRLHFARNDNRYFGCGTIRM
jgi:hypothetical protein